MDTILKPLNKLVLISLLIAVAVVINFFRIDIPIIAGAPVLRISFSSPFLAFIAIIGGPVYGAIAGALIDIIGYIIQPTGAYIPFLTITAMIKGLLFGLFWVLITKLKASDFSKIYIYFFSFIGIVGLINTVILKAFPQSLYSLFINSIGAKYMYASIGLILVFILSLAFYYIIKFISVKYDAMFDSYLQLIIVLGCSNLIITTINTYILKLFMPGLNKTSFILILIPRVMETLLILPIEAYILTSIVEMYNKINYRRTGKQG